MPRSSTTGLSGAGTSGPTKKKAKGPTRPSNAYLASLKATTLRGDTKAALPLELIAQILDYLPPTDLIRCAQTSKRLQEMVYDDTRWTQKLRLMGLWNEAEARQRFEESMKKKADAQKSRDVGSSRRTGVDLPGYLNGDAHGGRLKLAETLFDAHESQIPNNIVDGHDPGLSDSMSQVSLNTTSNVDGDVRPPPGSLASLDIMTTIRSIRGHSRQEFGKLYGALAPFYFDVVNQSHNNARVFRTFKEPEQQAKMLNNLRIFAQSDVTEGSPYRENRLTSMIAIFENAALREFEGGYYAREYNGRMKTYAHVLSTLNGGAAAVDMFIEKNPVMQQKSKFGKPLACLENPTASSVDLKPSQSFFHALSRSLDEQASIIDIVFPPKVDVMVPFLDRVAEGVIGEYITPLFDEAHRLGTDTYVQIVAGIFDQSLRFASSLSPATGSEERFHERASGIIIRCFEPHVDLYLGAELENLHKITNFEVESWEKRLIAEEESTDSYFMSSVNRQAAKRDFMTSFKKVIMMPVNILPGTKSAKPIASNASVIASGRDTPSIGTERPNTPRQEAPTTELAAKAAIMNSRLEGISSLFSIEVALNLVHSAKESLERCALFVRLPNPQGAAAKSQCQAIFVHLLHVLGHRHMKSGFDKAVTHLSDYNARDVTNHGASGAGVRPLVTFLSLVNVGDLIQQMVDVFYAQQLVSNGLTDRDDFLDVAVKEKKRFEQMLDERVAAGLNKGIDVLMDEVEFICSTTQAATDFRPGTWNEKSGIGNAAVSDIGPTRTAVLVVELVSSHTGMLTGSTEKNMLDVFNQEVGLRLFTSLCKHLKRQRISTDGAIILISDTNLYFGFIAGLKNKELLGYFKALRELSQIFLIEGKDAKELAQVISDGPRYGGIFRVEEVLEFAERRADWYQIKGNVEKALYGIGCLVM